MLIHSYDLDEFQDHVYVDEVIDFLELFFRFHVDELNFVFHTKQIYLYNRMIAYRF
jgi:hypothetical protein